MMLEALTPVLYCWPGGEIALTPGEPVDLPEERALRILKKLPGKVRLLSRVPISRDGGRKLYEERGWLVIDSLYLRSEILLARNEDAVKAGGREAPPGPRRLPPSGI